MPMTVIMPGMLQLAPGFLGTQVVVELLGVEGVSDARLFNVLLVALQLVLGLVFATVVVPPRGSVERASSVPPSAGAA